MPREIDTAKDPRGRDMGTLNEKDHDPHPWYGPCDAMMLDGGCYECAKVIRPETRTISLPVYRTPDGEQTCAIGTTNDTQCKFLGVRKFGQKSVCMLGENVDLFRRGADGLGYLIPHAGCLLWKGNNA